MELAINDEKVLYVSKNFNNKVGIIVWSFMLTIGILGLMFSLFPDFLFPKGNFPMFMRIVGILFYPFGIIFFINLIVIRIVVTNYGFRIKYLLFRIKSKERVERMSWESIEKIIVYHNINSLSIKKIYIVGKHPLSITYDEKQPYKQVFDEPKPLEFEPRKWWKYYKLYHRPVLGIPGNLKDINELIKCMKELVPDKIYEEEKVV